MLSLKFYLNQRTFDRVTWNGKISQGLVFRDTDRQVATVAMETKQLVLSQFKKKLTQ